MEITIDLSGCMDEKQVLSKFGEVFEFKVEGMPDGKAWGENWDALNDCLMSIDSSSTKLEIENSADFKNVQPEKFQILEEILSTVSEQYKKEGKSFEIVYI